MGTSFRLFVMMVLQLAIWGAWAPKIFPYMGMLGFAPWQQSLVGSAWGVAALVGIFFSNQFADRNFSAERFLAVSHLIGGVALLGTAFSTEFWPFFACYLVFSLVYVPTLSVTNSIAFANLRDPAAGFGGVRMGGTVGWVLVSWPFVFLLGAQATVEQVRWIFLVAAIVSFVFAGYALTLPHTPPRKADDAVDKLAWRRAFKLLGAPFVFVLFVVTFIDSVIHNGYFVMADAFLTNRVGIAGNLSMVVLSLGQVAEIITMLLLGRVLAKLGWKVTMIVGVLGHAARFAVFAYFADSVPVIVAVQLLHGVCYAFFFATVYIFVDAVFPKDVRSSAQGLFNLLILGVGNVAASFIFPALIGRLTTDGSVDYTTLFLVPTAMALAAVCLLALFFRPPTRGPVSEADSASSAASSAQA
ncbi:MFS transporter [Caulobacter vibrioides]|uniref:Membrane protein, putative n=2 Tax=Caulobacter vibrioides TaxID=155892 RepID=Q9A7U2_CAUVC|nr:MFS transporter [Caulobacter vibrioides]YP_002517073.1 3-ketohexose transporter [Caulobacter vibrioides NA1000]AAK23606.1 membrane protein, putative [Caulobacter vibrioides CB15]ACL95165.1 3-ketohexose transporter [Caulobacter vibrioides NA1000]ATC28511.1 nucleoside permease [Caulobacter vibrioides]QXZ53694.1 MFS transporter [Caulobacter vibrioides]